MKILELVARFLAGDRVSSGVSGGIIGAFKDVEERRDNVSKLREVARAHEVRIRELRSIIAGRLADADLESSAEALVRGETSPSIVSLQSELGNEERALQIALAAVAKARAAVAEARVARSFEICLAVQPVHRRIVREMARHLAHAERLTRQEVALRDQLHAGGVDLGAMIEPLSFSPFMARGGNCPNTSPYRIWLETIRRAGALRDGEDPAKFEADEAAGSGLGSAALEAVARGLAEERERNARVAATPSAPLADSAASNVLSRPGRRGGAAE